MKILIIDNYDSFTYNLVHLVKELTSGDVTVWRNDKFKIEDVKKFDKIILSPGPGIPLEAGLMPATVREYGSSKSILGVCLGHQCIGEIYGGTLTNLSKPFHGKAINTKVIVQDSIFKNVPEHFESARYHSWVVDSDNFPSDLEITASDENGLVMALRHKNLDVKGVQFHPESVLTKVGHTIMSNWLGL